MVFDAGSIPAAGPMKKQESAASKWWRVHGRKMMMPPASLQKLAAAAFEAGILHQVNCDRRILDPTLPSPGGGVAFGIEDYVRSKQIRSVFGTVVLLVSPYTEGALRVRWDNGVVTCAFPDQIEHVPNSR